MLVSIDNTDRNTCL